MYQHTQSTTSFSQNQNTLRVRISHYSWTFNRSKLGLNQTEQHQFTLLTPTYSPDFSKNFVAIPSATPKCPASGCRPMFGDSFASPLTPALFPPAPEMRLAQSRSRGTLLSCFLWYHASNTLPPPSQPQLQQESGYAIKSFHSNRAPIGV